MKKILGPISIICVFQSDLVTERKIIFYSNQYSTQDAFKFKANAEIKIELDNNQRKKFNYLW